MTIMIIEEDGLEKYFICTEHVYVYLMEDSQKPTVYGYYYISKKEKVSAQRLNTKNKYYLKIILVDNVKFWKNNAVV